MSRADFPGGGGGVSTQPWKGTYRDWGLVLGGVRGVVSRDIWEGNEGDGWKAMALRVLLCPVILGEGRWKMGAERTEMLSAEE